VQSKSLADLSKGWKRYSWKMTSYTIAWDPPRAHWREVPACAGAACQMGSVSIIPGQYGVA